MPSRVDTRFDWLVGMSCWTPGDAGTETLEVALGDLLQRSATTERNWDFEFVSWASARLIRTGEWYEVAGRETRHGIEILHIAREHPARA